MARLQLLLCFTILFASVTLLDVVSSHLTTKPALPENEDPKTVKDVEPYTVKVVMVFVSNLEKECPKTNKFKDFFVKLKEFAKYVCPINSDESVVKANAASIFESIKSFAVGKMRERIQGEKLEAMNNLNWMKSVAGKIIGGRKKDESEESMKLTIEQVKEVKEGILKWMTVIFKIADTMVESIATSSISEEPTSSEDSSSSEESSSSSSGNSFKDTTGSSSDFGSPTGSPSISPSGSSSDFGSDTESSSMSPSGSSSDVGSDTGSPSISPSGSSSFISAGTETSFTDTTGTASPASSPSGSSSSSESADSSENNAVTLTQVEADTSKEVMVFLMNLEKKCPPKEEFKSLFEQLKVTMTTAATEVSKTRKSFFSRIKSAAGKLSETMEFMRSRIEGKSTEVKKSLETYQGEVMKAVQELEAIHSQIVSQNKGKKGGALVCTPTQQKEIQVTITKWEQVTTKFIETAVQSETQTSSSTTSSTEKA